MTTSLSIMPAKRGSSSQISMPETLVLIGEKSPRTFSPTGLALFYLADAKNPDVYRLPPGKF